ncbi:hypothetical protein PG984_012171 [Apiospora sp. TS-2023a]
MAPAHISTLPPELLNQIVADIDPKDSASLAALARTSRRFQALVTPTLYHTVAFDMDKTEERRPDSSPLLAFVERMLAAPDRLAPLVRDFWINGTPEMGDLRPVLGMVCRQVMRYSRRSPHETSIEALEMVSMVATWEGVVTGARSGSWDTGEYVGLLATLLLPRLSSLRCARFGGVGSPPGLALLMEIIDQAQDPVLAAAGIRHGMPFWQELEEVELNGGFDEHPPSPDAIAFFAQWPSVKRIYSAGYINRDAGDQLETAFRSLKPSSLSLESLVLGPHTQLSHPHLDELLGAPRALRVFRYNFANRRTETKFRTAILQRSLERQKHALEELSLVHGYYKWRHANGQVYDEEHNLYGDILGPMSFAAFAKLRVLEISLPFVFGQAVVCFTHGTPPRRNSDVANPSPEQQRSCETRLLEMLPRSIETVRFAQCGDRWAARLLGSALVPLVDEVRAGAGGGFRCCGQWRCIFIAVVSTRRFPTG